MVEVVTGGELDGLGVELEGGGRGLNNDRWSGGWRGVWRDGGHRSGWPESEDVVVVVKRRGRRETHVPVAGEGALQDPDGVGVLGHGEASVPRELVGVSPDKLVGVGNMPGGDRRSGRNREGLGGSGEDVGSEDEVWGLVAGLHGG